MSIENLSLRRREFLGAGAAAGAMLLGFRLPAAQAAARGASDINAFVSVDAKGVVTLMTPFVEMGQGTYTSVPALIAEELDVDLSAVQIAEAPLGEVYRLAFGGTARVTGGSMSVRSSYEPLRKAGAAARAMLMQAAAERWKVPVSELSTENGTVVHAGSGRRATYGELAGAAARLSPPAEVKLKDPSRFRIIGKPIARTDAAAKSNGSARFGIDLREKDMLVAALRHAPAFGARVKSVDAAAVRGMPGVAAVEDLSDAVAVLADNYWHAKKALEALPVTFTEGATPGFSSAGHLEKLRSRLDEEGLQAENKGDVRAAFAKAARTLTADYHAPYLAHATMEPQNCAARVETDRCIVWAPNQAQDFVAAAAAEITKLPVTAIEVHTPFLGGGFGRRFVHDYVRQAVTLAARHPGRTVKVIWSREEDMQHDYYRPLIAARYRAALDGSGRPVAIHVTTVGDGPGRQILNQQPPEDSVTEGSYHQPYGIPNWRSDQVLEVSPVPVGYWRSVGHSMNAFFKESFIDEIARAVKADPVEFRRSLLDGQPRFRKVLDTAVEMAGWRDGKWRGPDGQERAMGVALHESFGSIVAEVAEVSIADGRPVVHRVWTAVDCGFAVNPLVLEHQVESAIAYGLSAALHEQIEVQDNRVTNANFDSYPILRAQEMPEVETKIINSGAALGGIGEVATPPIAPAVANAIFTLTGRRIRALPLRV